MIKMKEEDCLLKEDKPAFKNILIRKIEALKEEMEQETGFYKENGLFHERDVADIADELEIATRVLKKLDSIPECKRAS
jgi:hypothetical protein